MELLDEVKPLSEELKPKQLGQDERVVFKLCSIGKKEVGREEPTAPEVYQLSPKESVIDPFVKEGKDYKPTKKTIGTYVVEQKVISGQFRNIYFRPQFIKAYLTVGADQQPLYEFLMRSKKNKSNKFKAAMGGKKTPNIFELVEDSKEIQNQLHIEDLRFQAETIVRSAKWMALKTIAHTLNQSPDARLHVSSYSAGVKEDDLQGMKLELIHRAKLYPKQVIVASQDAKATATVEIFEAMNFGVLLFEKGSYALLAEKKGLVVIHTPEKDEDPIESLTAYLMSEKGQVHYMEMATLLKKALKA